MRSNGKWLLAAVLALMAPLASAASPIAGSGEPHGIVVTSVKRVAQQIYPVEIETLGDHNLATPLRSLRVKPGTYEVYARLREPVDRGLAPGLKYNRQMDQDFDDPPLRLTVEAGKTYYIGAKVKRPNEGLDLIVWKTEPSKR